MQNVQVKQLPDFPPMFAPLPTDRPLTPVNVFSWFFDDEVLEKITRFSNDYARQRNHDLKTYPNEIRTFLAIFIISGYNVLPRRRNYWENCLDMRNVLIQDNMRRNRFEELIRFFHVADNTTLPQNDKFAKVCFTMSNY